MSVVGGSIKDGCLPLRVRHACLNSAAPPALSLSIRRFIALGPFLCSDEISLELSAPSLLLEHFLTCYYCPVVPLSVIPNTYSTSPQAFEPRVSANGRTRFSACRISSQSASRTQQHVWRVTWRVHVPPIKSRLTLDNADSDPPNAISKRGTAASHLTLTFVQPCLIFALKFPNSILNVETTL